jgi:hypothetical protein
MCSIAETESGNCAVFLDKVALLHLALVMMGLEVLLAPSISCKLHAESITMRHMHI